MIIFILGILLLLVSLLLNKKYTPYVGFAFVFLIMGFQSNVKGDYYSYMYVFDQISSGKSLELIYNGKFADEPALPFLMKMLSFSSYELFILLLSLFETLVLANFVDKYCKNRYQFLSAIIFFVSLNMMLLQMKAIRQGFSIEIMLLTFILIDEMKKIWLPICAVIVAYLSHNSSLIFLPFLLLYWVLKKKPSILEKAGNHFLFPFIVLIVYILFFTFRTSFLNDYVAEYALLWGGDEFRYSFYFEGNDTKESFQYQKGIMPIIYFVYDSIVLFLISCLYQKSDARMRYFSIIAIIGIFVETLFWDFGSLTRLVMYFSIFNIVVVPSVANYIHHRYGNACALLFIIFFAVFTMRQSLPMMIDKVDDRFGNYQFFFIGNMIN